MIWSQAACRQDTVNMRVEQQSLIPGMQHAEEADLGSEMAWIAGHLEQCLGTCMEQQVKDELLVLQCNRSQFAWQREYSVHVARGQQFCFPRLEPAQAGVALALRAMPIATRVVRDGDVAAV